jgi:hypothetical protein
MIPGSKQSDDVKARKDGTVPPFRPDFHSDKQVCCKHCGETYNLSLKDRFIF